MVLIMSSSKALSISSGDVSSLSLARRNRMISSLVGVMDTTTTLSARYFSTSSRICNLHARNIRVVGDLRRILLKESSNFARHSVVHSSKASRHMKVGREEEIFCNICTISSSSSFRPPITFSCSRKAWTMSAGISSSPLTTCFRRELRMAVGDSSFWAAKSK